MDEPISNWRPSLRSGAASVHGGIVNTT